MARSADVQYCIYAGIAGECEKKFKITLTQYMDGPLAEYLAELSGPTPVGVIVRFFCFLKKRYK